MGKSELEKRARTCVIHPNTAHDAITSPIYSVYLASRRRWLSEAARRRVII